MKRMREIIMILLDDAQKKNERERERVPNTPIYSNILGQILVLDN